ncbi:hypothetical protein SLS53_008282 [Cytospora paraplurivora]|uniref:NAD(P)-binding protein n=1 Tax=Cytospora paraplurivora TaxID=2898453 RepID=A0AAN9U144_9PEZI
MTRVALITGGAGGMGLAVAQALAAQGGWQIHILDLKVDEGNQAAHSLPQTTFHRVDLVNYEEVAAAFKAAFVAGGNRLDFVFANAGTIERSNSCLLARSDTLDAPPPPDFLAVDVNLRGGINTVHAAVHYLGLSPEKGSIVVTGSCSSFWPTYWAPIYTASKFGLLGYVRSVAQHYKQQGIRVNLLAPGAVRTPIIPDDGWKVMPDDVFTPLELISEVVLKLAEGKEDLVDAKGVRVTPEELYGQAVLAIGRKFYVHPESEYSDDIVARTMKATKLKDVADLEG